MKTLLTRFGHDARGATAVEYGLIVALIVIAMMGALILFANTTTGMWNDISTRVSAT